MHEDIKHTNGFKPCAQVGNFSWSELLIILGVLIKGGEPKNIYVELFIIRILNNNNVVVGYKPSSNLSENLKR